MTDFDLNLPGYVLTSRLGVGGMGSVWKATQTSTGRMVAVKILHPEMAQNKTYVERFFREIRTALALNHPNIVRGLEAGEHHGQYYFVMEFIEGEPLLDIIKRQGRLDEKFALRIAVQIAGAIDYAWQRGFLHRDIKPQNILVMRDGTAKLTDLGIAKYQEDAALTSTGLTIGSPHYISPERARGSTELDVRSDIYSLGATLFHMLTGRTMYQAGSNAEIMAKHVTEPPPDPCSLRRDLSPYTAQIVLRMIQKDPDRRYQRAADAVADLQAVLNHQRPPSLAPRLTETRPRRSVQRLQESQSRTGTFVAIAAAAAIAVAGALVLFLKAGTSPPSPPPKREPPRATGEPASPQEDFAGKIQRLIDTGQIDEALSALWDNKDRLAQADYDRLYDQLLRPLADRRFAELQKEISAKTDLEEAIESARAALEREKENKYLVEKLRDRIKELEDEKVRRAKGEARQATHEEQEILRSAQAKFESGNTADATLEVSRLIENNPNIAEAHLLLARCLHRHGLTERALAAVDRSLQLKPSAAAQALRGELLAASGRFEEALAPLSIAIDRQPSAALYLLRARCLQKLGRRDPALLDCESALALESSNPEPFRLRAEIFSEVGNWTRVAEELTEVLRRAPDKRGYFDRAVAFLHARLPTLAAEDLKRALQIDPNFEEARAKLAECEKMLAQAGPPEGPGAAVFPLFDGKTRTDWMPPQGLTAAVKDGNLSLRLDRATAGLIAHESELGDEYTLRATLRCTQNFKGRQATGLDEFVGLILGYRRAGAYTVVSVSGNHVGIDTFREADGGRHVETIARSDAQLDLSQWTDLSVVVSKGKVRVLAGTKDLLAETPVNGPELSGHPGIYLATNNELQIKAFDVIATRSPQTRPTVRYDRASGAWRRNGIWEGKDWPVAAPQDKDEKSASWITREAPWTTYEIECTAAVRADGAGYGLIFFSAFQRDCVFVVGRDKNGREILAVGLFGTYASRFVFVNENGHDFDKPGDLAFRNFNEYRIRVLPGSLEILVNGKQIFSQSEEAFVKIIDWVRDESRKKGVTIARHGVGFGAWDASHKDARTVRAEFRDFAIKQIK